MADVTVYEVGPRDGLQNEKRVIPTAEKVALIDALSECGFRFIEAASFVSPKWVPQMADGSEVIASIVRREGVAYAALVPNARGLEAALAARVDEAAVFVSASEGFSKANLNCTIDESFERIAPVAARALDKGISLRGYVSCVTDCPFDGRTEPAQVAAVAARLFDLGCREVSLGDTIGQGVPETVDAMLGAVLGIADSARLAGHFHDTNGRALENVEVALERGLRVFDSAVGGLGGCPYAPGAAGNLATEALAERLDGLGHIIGLDLGRIAQAAGMARRMRTGAPE